MQPRRNTLTHLDVWLLLYAVDVLVQAVQQEAQELLAVVLLVAAELGRKLGNLGLERARHHAANVSLTRWCGSGVGGCGWE
jgi:hypothetical protein